MTLPTVRMEAHHMPASMTTLNLPGGVSLAFANGRVTVPWGSVREAIARGFIISDPAVRFPPGRSDMCPPSALPVLYPTTQGAPVVPSSSSGAYENQFPPLTRPLGPSQLGEIGEPAIGGATVQTRFMPAWRPDADFVPYAAITLPDGSTWKAKNPGTGIVNVPEQYISYFKGLGWLLLSEWM